MKLNFHFLLVSSILASLSLSHAALTVSETALDTSPSSNPATPALDPDRNSPAKNAIDAFNSGRYAKAVELARPLATGGQPDALYLLGFAHETGRGVEQSLELAMQNYRKAADKKQSNAIYRMSLILLGSEKKEEREQARELLESAAKKDPAAGRILGEAYLNTLLTEKPDPEKALYWWKNSASLGDVTAQLLLARFYEGQFGFPDNKDIKQAYDFYAKAAEKGDVSAMLSLGSRYLNGEKSLKNETKGREWLQKAIDAKDYTAFLVLGDYELNIKDNPEKAFKNYMSGKEAGQLDCMLRVADCYFEGIGTKKDQAKGSKQLAEAAEAGNPYASYRIALSLMQTKERTEDDSLKAYGHLLTAANAGVSEAQNELGVFYLSGSLGAADGPAAIAWLTRSAKSGNAQAQYNLGGLYERGMGSVDQNINSAGELYMLAAKQNHHPAYFALARMFYDGTGIKPDPVKAWAMSSLAKELGNTEAEALIALIATDLDNEQLKEAKEQFEKMKAEQIGVTKSK